jgi:hypothetical protein
MKFICRSELLALDAIFEMPKQEKGRELSPASRASIVDVVRFSRNCHRRMLLSLLLDVGLHCPHA